MFALDNIVELSRWQFALTSMYHFIFVPLTLGLSWILFIMESVYVMTGKQIYKDMTRFWGKLFGINFALGVTTGLTQEFQFGTNWAYYSHYVGDLYIDLTSRWVRKVVMDEIVFSETHIPMPTGETTTMNGTTERRITIEAVDQATFEEQE